MPIYQITPLGNPEALHELLDKKMPNEDIIELPLGTFLLAYHGRMRDLIARLGLESTPERPAPVQAYVAQITVYAGFGPAELWDWCSNACRRTA